ncbi:DUF1636 family protein [Chelatococcus reniformis]|uniref:Metal-binding protein n=1 Tax=Chelatococcus reniformis TaxID=1494448 RepID=A0A916USN9_9HYPH|nr:DUF1636 domain-containing protein [Chelatococcus reniformis]GGC85969.1 metal-binding protein [Chelatococcus reniformis]
MSAAPDTVLFVCTTCRRPTGAADGGYDEPGPALAEALGARLDGSGVTIAPMQCLSACKRPCAVALKAPGKWTYVVGDLDGVEHLDDVVAAARLYHASADGIVPWRERPLPFRKGVVARVPPLPGADRSTPETRS